MGGLRQLQTLDIRDTSITTLPKSIVKLHELEYIRAGTTPALPPLFDDDNTGKMTMAPQDPPLPPPRASSAPAPAPALQLQTLPSSMTTSTRCLSLSNSRHWPFRGRRGTTAGSQNCGIKVHGEIGELTALHTVGVIDVMSGARRVAILNELKKLTQLHKLGVSGINRGSSRETFGAISGHAHLKSLSIHLDSGNNQDCLDDSSSCLKNLNSLKLYGQISNLPVWIKDLKNLRKLKLQMPMLSQEAINFSQGFTKANDSTPLSQGVSRWGAPFFSKIQMSPARRYGLHVQITGSKVSPWCLPLSCDSEDSLLWWCVIIAILWI